MCNSQSQPDNPTASVPNIVTITINATTAVPKPPIITDSEGHKGTTKAGDEALITFASRGDTIRWDRTGDITAICIRQTGGVNLFSRLTPGSHDPLPATWVGIISDAVTPGQEEEYTIDYFVKGQNEGGKPIKFSQDPRIQIKPEDK